MHHQIERELAKVRAKQAAAMSDKSSTEAALEAGLRAAFDHAIDSIHELRLLEDALGEELDGGSFLLGMQCAVFAMQGTDAIEVAKLPLARRIFREYIAKARQR